MSSIINVSAKSINLPLKEAFETAQRRAEFSASVFIVVETSEGITGLGEATPVGYVTGEDQDSVIAAVEKVKPLVIGRDPAEYRLISRDIAEAAPEAKSARNGVESAVIDAFAKICGVPVYSLFGGKAANIETDVTIPIVPPDHAGELTAKAVERGFRIFKVKVGGKDIDEDTARCLAIISASPKSKLVIDANQGFTPEESVQFAKDLTRHGVEIAILEQPVPKEDIDGLKWVKEHTDVPVFADEAAQTPAQVINIAKKEAADGVNVKLMKAGIMGALDIVSICRSADIRLMLGCMLESRIGSSASLHVACGTQAFSQFDLDADQLLADQPVDGGFIREGAYLIPLDTPGLGCELRNPL